MFRYHVLRELSGYLDNQLSDKQKLKVERHLQGCQLCSQELSKLRLISQKLKAWQAPELGPFFEDAVKKEIAHQGLEKGEVKMKKKTLAILVPSGVLAGILVFAFLGSLYIQRGVVGRLRSGEDKIGEQFDPSKRDKPYYVPQSKFDARLSSKDQARFIYNGMPEVLKAMPNKTSYWTGTQEFAQGGENYEPYYINEGRYANRIDNTVSIRQSAMGNVRVASGGPTAPILPITPSEGSVIVIQPVLPATGEGEKIIRSAEVKLEVEDGKATYTKANEICQELDGYLASSNFYKDKEGREAGTITMRIPKDKFLAALEKLAALGKVESSLTNSQDVSQEYANLKARLDAAMVVYNKTLEALQKRQTTIPEAMRLESELTPILQRVEQLKNQIEYLNNAVSFTTVTLRFHEPQVSAKVLEESKNSIKESLLTAGINGIRFFAQAIPVVIVAVLWLGIIIGVAFLVKYWILRIFKRG